MGNSVKKSAARQKNVHGITVKRLPIGAYLSAAESIRELPENLLRRLFPDLSIEEAFIELRALRVESVLNIIGRGASVLPDELLGFVSSLLDVSVKTIRDELTPSELTDVLYEFWKINDLSNFIRRVKGAASAMR